MYINTRRFQLQRTDKCQICIYLPATIIIFCLTNIFYDYSYHTSCMYACELLVETCKLLVETKMSCIIQDILENTSCIFLIFLAEVSSSNVHFYTKQLSYDSIALKFINSYNSAKFQEKILISWEIYTNSTDPVKPMEIRFSSYFYAIHVFPGTHNPSDSVSFYHDFFRPFDLQILSQFSTSFLHLSQDIDFAMDGRKCCMVRAYLFILVN